MDLQLSGGAPAAGALEGGGAFRPKVDLGDAGSDVDKEECAVLAGFPHLGQLPEPLHRDDPGVQAVAAVHNGAQPVHDLSGEGGTGTNRQRSDRLQSATVGHKVLSM